MFFLKNSNIFMIIFKKKLKKKQQKPKPPKLKPRLFPPFSSSLLALRASRICHLTTLFSFPNWVFDTINGISRNTTNYPEKIWFQTAILNLKNPIFIR